MCSSSIFHNFLYTNVSQCAKLSLDTQNTKRRNAMTVGEKIKYYRNIRGISQEMLGNLSGINPATIKKYEYGIRNPKPDQLLKITNALGISINLFMDFDIETVSDVLSLLFKLDEQVDMKFEVEKDENGEFIPSTVKLSFQNAAINQKLCTYLKAKQGADIPIEDVKNCLVDDNRVVRKGVKRITVKVFPQ